MFLVNNQTKSITVLKSILYISHMCNRRPVFIILFCFFSSLVLNAQLLNEDYKKVSTVQIGLKNQFNFPSQFLWNMEEEILIIGYNYRPTQFEVYSTKTWEIISQFETKGHTYEPQSFFSPSETDIVYIKKNGGKALFKVNYVSGEVLEKTSCQKLEFNCPLDENYESNYQVFWKQSFPMDHYLFFENFALIINKVQIDVYQKD